MEEMVEKLYKFLEKEMAVNKKLTDENNELLNKNKILTEKVKDLDWLLHLMDKKWKSSKSKTRQGSSGDTVQEKKSGATITQR